MAEVSLGPQVAAQKKVANVKTIPQKEGQCPGCGTQTHEIRRRGLWGRRRKEPLTIEGVVLRGHCLLCHPIAAASSPAATPASQTASQGSASVPTSIEAKVRSLRSATTADEARKACHALETAARGSPTYQSDIAREGGIPVIVSTMKRHVDSAGVQEAACGALDNLAADAGAGHQRTLIVEEGGVQAIIFAMKRHVDSAKVQEVACRALGNFWWYMENAKEGGVHAVLGTIQAVLGAIQAVLGAMRRHEDVAEVQLEACWVLGNLSKASAENTTLIVREDGVHAVLVTMRRHADASGVQEYACGALCSLAVNDDNEALIGREGGVPAVLPS